MWLKLSGVDPPPPTPALILALMDFYYTIMSASQIHNSSEVKVLLERSSDGRSGASHTRVSVTFTRSRSSTKEHVTCLVHTHALMVPSAGPTPSFQQLELQTDVGVCVGGGGQVQGVSGVCEGTQKIN